MDDENYFMLIDYSVPPNRRYYTSNKAATPSNNKLVNVNPKYSFGSPSQQTEYHHRFFTKQKQGTNEKRYLKECIVKCLIPFINCYCLKEKVLSWLDLSSSHYSNTVTSYLNQIDIQFVDKYLNPQNCLRARPIETLWSILKYMVHDQG